METAISTIIVAGIGLIGIIIQTKSHNKIKNQKQLVEDIDAKIEKLQLESKEDDEKLNKKLDKIDMEVCKRFLVVEMTKIKNGDYIPNEAQKQILHETKKIYNEKGRR